MPCELSDDPRQELAELAARIDALEDAMAVLSKRLSDALEDLRAAHRDGYRIDPGLVVYAIGDDEK